MINYTPSNQLTLEGFKHPFYKQLKPDNRWVKLAEVIPWDELAGIYSRNLDPTAGRLSIDIRLVIGALVIKHKMKLSDRDTVDLIGENVYMQYFCGLKGFQNEPPFDASLFVDIRKRMGADKFDEFNETVIRKADSLKPKRKRIMKDPSGDQHDTSDNTEEPGIESRENDGSSSKKDIPNQGKLKLDASVADQHITYPTDLKLLNTARHETERMIDIFYKKGDYDTKPLGRPPKQELSGYQKYKTRKEQNMRNYVEGKFGQGKNGYNLNQIRARRQDTSKSWISAILFVMNLTKLMKVAIDYGNFLTLFVLRHLRKIFLPVVINNGIPVIIKE